MRLTPLRAMLTFSEHVLCDDHRALLHFSQRPCKVSIKTYGNVNGGSKGLSRLPRVTWMRGRQDPGPGLPNCKANVTLPELVETFS